MSDNSPQNRKTDGIKSSGGCKFVKTLFKYQTLTEPTNQQIKQVISAPRKNLEK